MPQETGSSGSRANRVARLLGVAAVAGWLCAAMWNSVKPLPPGTHVAALPARLAESQIEFIDDREHRGAALARELGAVAHAEQTIVLDQCPLARELAEQLLVRKRQRPNLKILLVTDPRNEIYGGTPAQILRSLEAAGIVVARVRLDRMRDSNPLYSSMWRLGVAWWSDPFDETPGEATLLSALRKRNFKADQRQLLVADDGGGGWISVILSTAAAGGGGVSADVGLVMRGYPARDIVASELQVARWSTDDDRLPELPPMAGRGVGTIDARFLSEGAIRAALCDALAAAVRGDIIEVMVPAFEDRQLVTALSDAAARGAHALLVLDPDLPGTQAAAHEMQRGAAGNIEVRWRAGANRSAGRYAFIRHGGDIWADLGSANFTRRGLDDLNLAAAVELHMPASAAPMRAAQSLFTREWSAAAPYIDHADESPATYWRYRLAEATGLTMF